jgi:hypothetical protein
MVALLAVGVVVSGLLFIDFLKRIGATVPVLLVVAGAAILVFFLGGFGG